jgi:predicted nucleotidyltransferase
VALPGFLANGDLPEGVHAASLSELLARFGVGSPQREAVALRLERIYRLATSTRQVARMVVFGSFVTSKPEPNDVDVFLLMEDTFDLGQVLGEARFLFDLTIAQIYFGASVLWMCRRSTLGGEAATIEDWQTKRDGSRRGIVEILLEER